MKSLKIALFTCLLSTGALAQQVGWLSRLEPDFAELNTNRGPVQFTLDSPQYTILSGRGLGSRWKVRLGSGSELSSAEFLGISPSTQLCLTRAEQLLQLMDDQDWPAIYESLSAAARDRYSPDSLEDYWRRHWLSSLPCDRKLLQQSEDRCCLLVAGKGVSFGRYGQPMGSLHRLDFVKEGSWRLDGFATVCRSEWNR